MIHEKEESITFVRRVFSLIPLSATHPIEVLFPDPGKMIVALWGLLGVSAVLIALFPS